MSQLLGNLPNDGTSNQEGAFARGIQKATKYGCCFGFDLSAATDRLPLYLQIQIVASLYGKDIAESWAQILVGRPYYMVTQDQSGITGATPYYYAVGQPMGALSSFNMLGLTHHLIVQYCSRMLNPSTN